MIFIGGAWVICLFFIFVRGGLFNHTLLRFFYADLIVITMAYLLTHYGDTGTGIFAFGMGLITDVLSAGPLGLFAFLYLTTFLGIRFGCLLFDLLSITGQILLITMADLLKEFFFIAFLKLFSMEIIISSNDLFALIASAICTGLLTPLIFNVYERLDRLVIEGKWGGAKENES